MPQRTCGVAGCPNAHRAKGLCSSHYNQQHQPNRHRKSTVRCGQCSKPTVKHVSSRFAERFCSLTCRDLWRKATGTNPAPPPGMSWTPRRRAVVRLERAARGTTGARWVAGNCARCGQPFVSAHRHDPGRYCSPACKRRTKASRRRARKRNAVHVPYSRTRVFERDGYRCHLCKRMTKRTAVVPHPRAPVIDHLVPLGQGDDAQHNVATACFLCNSKRRDVGPAQLILFG